MASDRSVMSGNRSAISIISPIRAQQSSTTSHPAAMAPVALSPALPDSAFMSMSSVISRPLNPIRSRMIFSITVGDSVAGRLPSHASKTM